MFKRIAVFCFLTVFLPSFSHTSQAGNFFWDDGASGGGDLGTASKLWSDFFNWNFDGFKPGPADEVFVGVAVNGFNVATAIDDITLLDNDFTINSLYLGAGAHIINSADGGATTFKLNVNNLTKIGSGTHNDSVLELYDAPPGFFTASFKSGSLDIQDAGVVKLDSVSAASSELAVLEVNNGLLDIQAGGVLYGNGLVRLTDSISTPFTLMRNNGTITAGDVNVPLFGTPAATTLQISSALSFARFDWDGTAGINTTINVRGNATLGINVVSSDAYGGTLNLSTNATFDVSHDWLFNGGVMNVNTSAFGLVGPGQEPNPGPAAHIAGNAWTMLSGTISIDNKWDSLQLDSNFSASGGTIENSGTMIFNAPASIQNGVDFNMNGGGAALVINAGVNIATPDFNLDGVGQFGNVTTINSGGVLNMALGAGADEEFNHTINLNGGQLQVATTDNDWNLESSGKINAAGGGTSIISGETFNVHGKIDVSGNSNLTVSADSAYSPTANVVIEAGSTLNHADVTYDGGSYTGGGVLRKGNATILENTTWNVAVVDIDDGTTTVKNGAELVVNADSIDSSGDGIDSHIEVETAGVLTFNLSGGAPVVIDPAGSISYTGTGITRTFLTGSDITMNGTMIVDGDGRSAARLDIGGTVEIIDTGFDRPFRLGGGTLSNPNTLNGGTINDGSSAGPTVLSADDGKALHGFGSITVDVEFLGNSHLIAENGVLTLTGNLADVGLLGTSGAAAVLKINSPWNTNVTEQVLLQGGILQGNVITNDGVNGIDGFGEVTAKIINNSRLSASGGTMIYSNNSNDWDGAGSGSAQIIADNGDIELRSNTTAGFVGTLQVDAGRELFTNGFSLHPQLSSHLILTGGTYRSTHSTTFEGGTTVNAGSDSTMQVAGIANFWNGSTIDLFGNLRLENTITQLEDNITFSGGGALINTPGSLLQLFPNAAVDVLLENEGTMVISGTNTGQTTGLDFEQAASGVWEVDLGGTAFSDFDSMHLTGAALLDGTLDLSLLMGYSPEFGDTFDILSATSGVTGMFASILQPGTMPSDLIFDINYLGSIVQLEVVGAPVYTADFDNDGDVDADDLAQWQGDFGGSGSDADGDGDSDGFDFLAWQQQLGSGVSALAASTSVPEPSTLFLTGLAACFGSLLPRYKRIR